jgi:hypothetical protein
VIDGGYSKADHWLSDGWAWVRENDINAPLYWLKNSGNEWSRQFSLNGILSLNPDTPVCHVSYYEADASQGGPAIVYQPRPNGRALRVIRVASSGRISIGLDGIKTAQTPAVTWICRTYVGSGLPHPFFHTQDFVHRPGQSVNITANSCPVSLCFEAEVARHLSATQELHIAIFSILTSGGSSLGCVSRGISNGSCRIQRSRCGKSRH